MAPQLESLDLDLELLRPNVLDSLTRNTAFSQSILSKTLFDLTMSKFLVVYDGLSPHDAHLRRGVHLRVYAGTKSWMSLEELGDRIEDGRLKLSPLQSIYLPPRPEDDAAAALRLGEILSKQGIALYFEDTPEWSHESLLSPKFFSWHRGLAGS